MKEIKAIIQPFKLASVVSALKGLPDLPGITVSEVKGFGKNRARDARERIVEDAIDYVKKAKVEIVVPDALVDEVVRVISAAAHTGRPGDGKIFVSAVDEVVMIRTGETGDRAI